MSRPEIPGGFCSLCGKTNLAGLGQVIGICLDAAACHERQARRRHANTGEALIGDRICRNCGEKLFAHCTVHWLPCCPGQCREPRRRGGNHGGGRPPKKPEVT